jgi:hypothetical protein
VPKNVVTGVGVVSVIMDLDARRLWVTDGPPCEAEYQLHQLSD